MSEKELKKLWDNPPEGSELANLKEAMEEAIMDTINKQIKDLMTRYSLTYGEAIIILQQQWESYKQQDKRKKEY